MLENFKKNFFSFTGLTAFLAVAGGASAIVTMFVNTAEQVSIKWFILFILVASWVVVILLKIIFNLEESKDDHAEIHAKQIEIIRSLEQTQSSSFHEVDERLNALKTELESETIAITATCIPFENIDNDSARLFLVQNPNFGTWWLAPGGHAELREDGFPDKIAIDKCLSEAGLNVTLVDGPITGAGAYRGCETRSAPHFCYLLDLPQTSRCTKSKHHRKHYDLTFVAVVRSHVDRNGGSHDRKDVVLRFDMDEAKVKEAIVRAVLPPGQKIDGTPPFPADLPARVHASLVVLKQACIGTPV